MAEFPAKVSTHTSTHESSGPGFGSFCAVDLYFLRSIPGLLMIIELVCGLLVWALIADNAYTSAAYGWVMFVAVLCWVLTLILFILLLLQLHRRLSMVPWPLVIFIYHTAATLLYITAFITCAASVRNAFYFQSIYNKRAAASFFSCVVMIAYGASTFFSFTDWRGPGSNAASAQA